MDKYEYKVRADEIKSLIEEGDFAEAVKIADTIDWRRVRSVMMLCTVSDLYKINRRYQESKDILLMANERRPSSRAIVYSLCELSIKMDDLLDAVKYYNIFVDIAPKDTGKYVLLYKLYEAQDISLEERIAVLEEFKKRDYREKWAYELAYLYHRIGLATKCIEECDEIYLWFGEGKYVLKALELKSLHVPLSNGQQEKYDSWIKQREEDINEENARETQEAQDDEDREQSADQAEAVDSEYESEERSEEEENADIGANAEVNSDIMSLPTTELPEVKTVDVGQYNTLNLQMVLAEGMKEIMPEETEETQPSNETDSTSQPEQEPESEEQPDKDEEEDSVSIAEKLIAPLLQDTSEMADAVEPDNTPRATAALNVVEQEVQEIIEQIKKDATTAKIPAAEIKTTINQVKYDDVLSQEYDGQIRLVIPDEKVVEKQITGQLSIEDIMAEWEEMKKDNEQKRMEDVKRRILSRTGGLFADYDEATRNGLLEELEKAFVDAINKDSEKESAIKKVVYPSGIESNLNNNVKEELQKVSDDAPVKEAAAPPQKEFMEDEVTADFEKGDVVENEGDIEREYAEEKESEIEREYVVENKGDIEKEYAVEKESEIEKEHTIEKSSDISWQDRELTEEEQELFGRYAHHKKSKEQLVHTLDNMSMAAYTGNVIITGEEDGTTMPLAKNLIREMQYNDSNFSGKVARISAAALNKKDISETLKRLSNGALIVEKAADLNEATVSKLSKVLENENIGLLMILEDTKKRMNDFLTDKSVLNTCFNLRIDVEPLDDEALVAYARQYAQENEYSIDEFGVLALHTRIADMQTSDHEVSVSEVRELVDDAIYYANKKTPKHFFDILLAKRYDDEDMIILREKDFMHY